MKRLEGCSAWLLLSLVKKTITTVSNWLFNIPEITFLLSLSFGVDKSTYEKIVVCVVFRRKRMKTLLCLAVLFFLGSCALGKQSPPKVQVYSRNPGKLGEANTLICHVSGFHPPDITITLLKNGEEIPDSKQTDLAFESGWQFHLTKYVPFHPKSGEVYTCKVRHMTTTKIYTWEPDM